MTEASVIFGRDVLLKTLKAECLSEVGSSAVIVGGRKVGKTHLLHHILAKVEQSVSTLYCRVDVDMLKALAPKGEVTDRVFLREFLRAILAQIDDGLTSQQAARAEWAQKLPAAEAKAGILSDDLSDPAIQALHKKQLDLIAGYRQKIGEYDDLSSAANMLRALTEPARTLQVDELGEVFTKLRALKKRIILMIDDYDQMVRQPGLTDQLFAFLRGANNERKIITLVSARARLMDVVVNTVSEDRKSLFNHFQTQRLIPFRQSEPFDFLDWLGRPGDGDNVALTEEEKKYIHSLGGGCPHLLMLARARFIQQRPAVETAVRRRFEKDHLQDDFQEVFDGIWASCDEDEQNVLRDVAAGIVVAPGSADRLETDGYVLEDHDHLVLFSSLFSDFVKKRSKLRATAKSARAHLATPPPSAELRPVECDVSIPYEVFPSALIFATPESANIATFTVKNLTSQVQNVQLRCQLMPHSNPREKVAAFQPGDTTVSMQVDLKDESRAQTNTVWTSVEYSVTLDPGAREQVLLSSSARVRLVPRNHFLFARFDPVSRSLTDFSWLIAAWVNAQEPALRAIQNTALAACPQLGRQLARGEDPYTFASGKAEALYKALNDNGLKYFDEALVFHQNDNDYMQRVKTPAETLEAGKANCLDGSVLMASLLSLCSVEPGIVLLPGHAVVGWKVPGSEPARWEFLDTTVLGQRGYAEAVDAANDHLKEIKSAPRPSGALIADPQNFAILVDVHQTIADRKIVPI